MILSHYGERGGEGECLGDNRDTDFDASHFIVGRNPHELFSAHMWIKASRGRKHADSGGEKGLSCGISPTTRRVRQGRIFHPQVSGLHRRRFPCAIWLAIVVRLVEHTCLRHCSFTQYNDMAMTNMLPEAVTIAKRVRVVRLPPGLSAEMAPSDAVVRAPPLGGGRHLIQHFAQYT